MKPVLVDTTLWIQWMRGGAKRSRQALQGRFLWMSSVVAAELTSGARNKEAVRALQILLTPFERNRRCVVPSWSDYLKAGETLAHLNWPSSPKLNDALIAVTAKKIGAEIWTSNAKDFESFGKRLGVSVHSPE